MRGRARKMTVGGTIRSSADSQRLPRALGWARLIVTPQAALPTPPRGSSSDEERATVSRTPKVPCTPCVLTQECAHDPFLAPRALHRFQPPLVHAGDTRPRLRRNARHHHRPRVGALGSRRGAEGGRTGARRTRSLVPSAEPLSTTHSSTGASTRTERRHASISCALFQVTTTTATGSDIDGKVGEARVQRKRGEATAPLRSLTHAEAVC